jgi:hypothetical protein
MKFEDIDDHDGVYPDEDYDIEFDDDDHDLDLDLDIDIEEDLHREYDEYLFPDDDDEPDFLPQFGVPDGN